MREWIGKNPRVEFRRFKSRFTASMYVIKNLSVMFTFTTHKR